MQTANLPLSRFAKLTVIATFGLIFMGGMVTSRNAGLAVPDWPASYGYNMFAFPISRWVGDVFWEHTHRLAASLVGFLTIILAAWIWGADRRRWVRVLGLGALALVIVQGVMGGLRVTEHSIVLAMIHGCTAQAFLCVLTLLALALSPVWWKPMESGRGSIEPDGREIPRPMGGAGRLWAWSLVAAVFVQLMIGAVMRHLHAGLAIPTFPLTPEGTLMPKTHNTFVDIAFTHRFWAAVVTVLTIFVVARVLRWARHEARLVRPALILMSLVLLQICLGMEIIWLARAPIPTTLHVLNGAAVLVASFILAVRSSRFTELAKQSPDRPPARPITA